MKMSPKIKAVLIIAAPVAVLSLGFAEVVFCDTFYVLVSFLIIACIIYLCVAGRAAYYALVDHFEIMEYLDDLEKERKKKKDKGE